MDIVARQRINILIHLAEIQSASFSSSPVYGFIKRVADECGFSSNDLIRLIGAPDEIPSLGALSESQRKDYMYNICELMTLITPDQQKKLFCQKLAYDLNYDSNQMNVIIEQYQSQVQVN